MSSHRFRTTCRLCSGPTTLALELTPTPPANELRTRAFVEDGEPEEVFPLPVHTCDVCGHVQLACVVDPERLFRNYPYRSGASPVFVDHLRRYADDLVTRFGMPKFVVEIGSNDGTMLKMFKERGVDVAGVDPFDMDVDYPLVRRCFSSGIAGQFRRSWPGEYGREYGADFVIANHVFAHADDLEDIVVGVRELLAPEGVFVFEVGYLLDVLRGMYFDTIYHEHLSYHHLGPLKAFFARLGMCLFDAERVDTQGGSIRCYVCYAKSARALPYGTSRMGSLMQFEALSGLGVKQVRETVSILGVRVQELKTGLLEILHELKADGYSIAGYGAPAKCVTLMHHLGFGNDVLDFIVDDSPIKHGLFTPGKHVEILPVSVLYERKPDYVLVLAWNFAESIMAKHRKFDGSWIVPLPKVVTHFSKRH